MSNEIINFEAAKDRRDEKAIDADQERWEQLCDQLVAVMVTSDLSSTAITSATLRALLEVIQEDGLEETKKTIAMTLKTFR